MRAASGRRPVENIQGWVGLVFRGMGCRSIHPAKVNFHISAASGLRPV